MHPTEIWNRLHTFFWQKIQLQITIIQVLTEKSALDTQGHMSQ